MASRTDYERLGAWAVLLEPDMNIDRRHAVRTVPMQVLCLGLPRTGTLSMQEALGVLGYANPYHMNRVFGNVKDADLWQEAFAQQQKARQTGVDNFNWRNHFDQLLGHSSAVTDMPAVAFWRELIHAYPEAKVVLVERDVEKWLPSVSELLDGALNPAGRYVLQYTDPFSYGRIFRTGVSAAQSLFESSSVENAKAKARECYTRHYAAIRAKVPTDRLLNFRLESGWKPLCEFLGKEVPPGPFPHRNEAKTLELCFSVLLTKTLKASLFNISIVVGIGAALWGILSRIR